MFSKFIFEKLVIQAVITTVVGSRLFDPGF